MKRITGFASLSVALTAATLDAEYNVQLFPDGDFAAGDGRPGNTEGTTCKTWRMDEGIARRLLADLSARAVPLVVDYEHQTFLAAKNGQPAPAAGWIKSYVYRPGAGLYAQVTWTERARHHITAGEYRYISPAFTYDRKTGEITRLLHAGLTNTPALDGMMSVAASRWYNINEPQAEDNMDQFLARLRALLGLPDTADAEAVCKAIDAQKTALAAAKAEADKRAEALKAEAKAKDALSAGGDASAPLSALVALQHEIAALKDELAGQRQAQSGAEIDAAVKAALADGRLPKSLESWARDLGKKDQAALKIYLDGAKPLAALNNMQTDKAPGKDAPGAGTGNAALSSEEKYAADQLGISHGEYAKMKETA
jgi:phage I-like protein